MFFEIDSTSGSILREAAPGKLVHIFPTTIFQYELFNKSQKDNKLSIKIPDINQITSNNFPSYFMTNINLEEAAAFCKWVGGRFLTNEEWDENFMSSRDVLTEAYQFACKFEEEIDPRQLQLLKFFVDNYIQWYSIYDHMGNLNTEYKDLEMYGRIYFKSSLDHSHQVVGAPPYKTKNPRFAFTYIIGD